MKKIFLLLILAGLLLSGCNENNGENDFETIPEMSIETPAETIVYSAITTSATIEKTEAEVTEFSFPTEYEYIGSFIDGLALIESEYIDMDRYIGFIDESGEIIIPMIYPLSYKYYQSYDDMSPLFSEGLVNLCNFEDRKWGYLDATGEVATPFIYGFARQFSEGLATVLIDNYDDETREVYRSYGYIDRTGKTVIPFQFENARSFSEGLAAVWNEEYKAGFIDKTGNIVIPLIYYGVNDFSDGLAAAYYGDDWNTCEWGFIDKTGKVIIPFEYEMVGSFNNGWVSVVKDEKLGFIDKQNNIVIPFEYDYASNFHNGAASVRIEDEWVTIDINGDIVIN